MAEPLPEGNWPIIAASPIPYFPYSQVPREMDRRDMDAGRDDLVRAGRMAGDAGFDVLEIHFAPGCPPASFIFPLTNRGTHGYSGQLPHTLHGSPSAVCA